MLEKERFLAIKKLAREIRKDNKELLKKIENMPAEKSVKEKDKFIDSVMEDVKDAFSAGEQGKEEKQIFRANILIPDDDEFYETYSNNKNIRNLMNKYNVNIEDIMSKITELNIYGKYSEEPSETDFVDEMVKITPKQAEDLLDEIDDLSNTLTNLDISQIQKASKKIKEPTLTKEFEIPEEISEKKSSFINEDIKEEIEKEEIKETELDDNVLDESFDSINRAITGFVTDYNSIKEKVKNKEDEIKELQDKIRRLNLENEKLTDENNSLHSRQSEYRQENNNLKSDNNKLNDNIKKLNIENEKITSRMKLLEDKLIKTAALLNKVYNGIHKD